MTFKKNQKAYNTQLMNVGKEAMGYLSNALGLINKYTEDYAGRNEFWLNKLNNRQLDLLSDKYLAQNASMLRGSAAFGSNSETNRQIENNAYSQQNYLANVANDNTMKANQLQNNELDQLREAASTYNYPIVYGQNAASNVDAANNYWMTAIGKSMNAVGDAVKFMGPYGAIAGAALKGTGSALTSIGGENVNIDPNSLGGQNYTADQWAQFGNELDKKGGWSGLGSSLKNLFTGSKGQSNTSSSLSATNDFINSNGIGDYRLKTNVEFPTFKLGNF